MLLVQLFHKLLLACWDFFTISRLSRGFTENGTQKEKISSEPCWRKCLVNVRGQRSESADWWEPAGRQRRQKITTGCKQSLQTGHFIRHLALARCNPMKCESSVVPFQPLSRCDCASATVSPSCLVLHLARLIPPPARRLLLYSALPLSLSHLPLVNTLPFCLRLLLGTRCAANASRRASEEREVFNILVITLVKS